jgi:hypothetical protein
LKHPGTLVLVSKTSILQQIVSDRPAVIAVVVKKHIHIQLWSLAMEQEYLKDEAYARFMRKGLCAPEMVDDLGVLREEYFQVDCFLFSIPLDDCCSKHV